MRGAESKLSRSDSLKIKGHAAPPDASEYRAARALQCSDRDPSGDFFNDESGRVELLWGFQQIFKDSQRQKN